MEVQYGARIAIHTGPEPCGGARESVGEAVTGETAGQPVSREIGIARAPTLLSVAESNSAKDRESAECWHNRRQAEVIMTDLTALVEPLGLPG